MTPETMVFKTTGEGFYEITRDVIQLVRQNGIEDGVVTLFCLHTSCALTINEAFDPSAKKDMESFLRHLAPRNLAFIQHTAEGPDDSPSHMKALLLQPSLQFVVSRGDLMLGRWQGIYLAEFRDGVHERQVVLKLQPDR